MPNSRNDSPNPFGHPETNEFPAADNPWGNIGNLDPFSGYSSHPGPANSQAGSQGMPYDPSGVPMGATVPAAAAGGSSSNKKVLLIIAAILVGIALLAALAFFGIRSMLSSGEDDTVIVYETVTPTMTEEAPETTERPTSTTTTGRTSNPNLPAGLVPVSTGRDNGHYANVYKSGPTSDSFAISVANDFNAARGSKERGITTVDTYSPVTGITYTMTCNDNGEYVHCTGGNNANVFIV